MGFRGLGFLGVYRGIMGRFKEFYRGYIGVYGV